MTDHRPGPNRWWDAPYVFWALLGLGLAAFVGLFLLFGLMPDDSAEREVRSAQLEAQAVAAEDVQARERAAAKSKRADLMD